MVSTRREKLKKKEQVDNVEDSNGRRTHDSSRHEYFVVKMKIKLMLTTRQTINLTLIRRMRRARKIV